MSNLILKSKPAKSIISPAQKTFNLHKKKIEKLKNVLNATKMELDRARDYYQSKLLPVNLKLSEQFLDFVKDIYERFYIKPKLLSKSLRNDLKNIFITFIQSGVSFSNNPRLEDVKVLEIVKALTGKSYDELCLGEVDELKERLAGLFEEAGVDFPDSDEFSNINDWFEKMQECKEEIFNAFTSKEENKPKSKNELLKEAKAQELEQLQKNGIGSIYKKMAKVYHPDLEQDPEKKADKEHRMKKLTEAYDNKDLYTLLSLEREWMDPSEDKQNIDHLKIFNSILKDQIKDLELEIEMISAHPKYIHIQSYIDEAQYQSTQTYTAIIHRALVKNQDTASRLKKTLEILMEPNGLEALKTFIRIESE